MNDELDSLSDQELSERFAVEVAGWTRGYLGNPTMWVHPDGAPMGFIPEFSRSADAVLPFCEKFDNTVIVFNSGSWSVEIQKETGTVEGEDYDIVSIAEYDDPKLARAACLALLKAKEAK